MKSFVDEAKLAIYSQIGVVAALSFLLAIIARHQVTLSFLLGGVIAILPNIYLAWKSFSHQENCPKRFFGKFLRGQAGKWLLIASGFAIAAKCKGIIPLALFIGFIFAQMGFSLLPLKAALKKRYYKVKDKNH